MRLPSPLPRQVLFSQTRHFRSPASLCRGRSARRLAGAAVLESQAGTPLPQGNRRACPERTYRRHLPDQIMRHHQQVPVLRHFPAELRHVARVQHLQLLGSLDDRLDAAPPGAEGGDPRGHGGADARPDDQQQLLRLLPDEALQKLPT